MEDAEHCLEVVRRNLLLACACKPSGLAAGTGAAMAHKSNPYKKARRVRDCKRYTWPVSLLESWLKLIWRGLIGLVSGRREEEL